MKETTLMAQIADELLNPECKLKTKFLEIESEKVDWTSLESASDKIDFAIKNFGDLIPEPIISGVILKNKEKALEIKDRGNALFKEGKLLEAREAYTEAMRYFPVNEKDPEGNKDYAVIVANRSATSEGLKIFPGVLQDVDLALKYGYPREMHYKVLNRKANALKKMKQFFSSKACYKQCLDMIGKSDMPTKLRDQWRARCKKQISLFGVKKDAKPAVPMPHPFANLADNPSENISEISSKLDFKDDSLIAKKNINTEDRLLLESPVVKVISDPKARGKWCPYALKKMPAPVPCLFGSMELFFDEETRSKATLAFHKYEWSILKELNENLSPTSRLAYRLILKDFKQPLMERKETLSKEEALCVGLLGVYLSKCLKKTKFPKEISPKLCAETLLFAHRNKVSISMLKKIEDKKELMISGNSYPHCEFGLGIYPQFNRLRFQSKSSHSNDVFLHFIEDQLLVVSNRKISEGSRVSFKFSPGLGSLMKDVVLFKCDGAPKCQVSFPLKEKTNEQLLKCPLKECGLETNIWKRLKRLHELKRDVAIAKEIFQGATSPDAVQDAIARSQAVVDEFDTFTERPYTGVQEIENDMKKFILYNMFIKEEEWNGRSDTV